VRTDCRSYAIETGQAAGVWGGASEGGRGRPELLWRRPGGSPARQYVRRMAWPV